VAREFTILDKKVTETATDYIVEVTAFIKNSERCPGCIQQIVVGIKETAKPIKCVYDGIPGVKGRTVKFKVTVSKSELGDDTLIAAAYLEFGCSYAIKKFKQGKYGLYHELLSGGGEVPTPVPGVPAAPTIEPWKLAAIGGGIAAAALLGYVALKR